MEYWEDYYIMKYNTIFPKGYNKKWNCSKEIRKNIEDQIKNDFIKKKPAIISTDFFAPINFISIKFVLLYHISNVVFCRNLLFL